MTLQKRIRPGANEADRLVSGTIIDRTFKTCTSCRVVKCLVEFAVDRSKPTGFRPVCAQCRADYDRERRRAEPHHAWEADYRRRCRARSLLPVVRSFTRDELVEVHGDHCVDCGGPWDQLDHRIPVAAGGTHDLDNCRPICQPCNSRKLFESDRPRIAKFRAGQVCSRAVTS